MKEKFKSIEEVLEQAIKENLYANLVAQIQKDFSLANITFNIPEDVESNELIKLLQEKLYVLNLERFNEYLNLLYVVDVPEKLFKGIKVTDVVEVSSQVNFLIIQREFQKVRLKAKYK